MIAAAVAATELAQLQQKFPDAAWDPLALDERRVRWLVECSPKKGVLLLDEVGLPKQGNASVGVQHQYCGALGKQGNCQVVVSAQYVVDDANSSRPFHWPLTARLYLPRSWAEDQERGPRCHVPESVPFATKPELALHLLDQARAWGVAFATVVADAGYGIPSFLRALEKREVRYVCAVASDFGVRLPQEMGLLPTSPQRANSPHGGGHPKLPRPASRYEAQFITQAQPEQARPLVQWREGSRSSLRKQFIAIRVHAATGCARHSQTHGRSWTGPEGWLLAERPLPGEEGKPKWYFSNLPADTPLLRLVELAHLRWPIEQFYEDGKGECGLADFQGRTWEGLHRHLARVLLAYTFLMLQSLSQGEETGHAANGGFPPCTADQSSRLPPLGARPAFPGSGLMAH